MMKYLLVIVGALTLWSLHAQDSQEVIVDAVMDLHVPTPTADKPQSKIWWAHDAWWALLPHENGAALYQRSESGWSLQTTFESVSGKADVYADEEKTITVLVGECELKVVDLSYENEKYNLQSISSLKIPKECNEIETATITKDDKGIWWIASDMNQKILVWSSKDGHTWSKPQALTVDISKDDISVISRLSNGVSVIWSNQLDDNVSESIHLNESPFKNWSEPQIIAEGNHTADDHLNTTLLKGGTLVLVSKNSLDQLDQSQFVLRIRDKKGIWKNFPYCNLTNTESPTRPVVMSLPNGSLITLHTVAVNGQKQSFIAVSSINLEGGEPVVTEHLHVKSADQSHINNVTVAKNDFLIPESMPYIVLFSDKEGRVYELNLSDYPILFSN